jgi:hypothetical protein
MNQNGHCRSGTPVVSGSDELLHAELTQAHVEPTLHEPKRAVQFRYTCGGQIE